MTTELKNNIINAIAEYRIEQIIEDLKIDDVSFLDSIIKGDGFIQLNNLKDSELLDELKETEMELNELHSYFNNHNENNIKSGFYTENDKGDVVFKECLGFSSKEVDEIADEILNMGVIDTWASFNGVELNDEAFKLLVELGVTRYNHISASQGDDYDESHTEAEQKLFDLLYETIDVPRDQKENFIGEEFDFESLIKRELMQQIDSDIDGKLDSSELVELSVQALYKKFGDFFPKEKTIEYIQKIVDAIEDNSDEEESNIRNFNIEECEVCSDCKKFILPDDECYESHDGSSLCVACSCLCEGCDKYYKKEEGFYDEHGFCCTDCKDSSYKEDPRKLFILGHEIKVESFNYSDDHIDSINQAILDGNDSGTLEIDGIDADWEIVAEHSSYLDEKVEILDEKDRVIFEHEQLFYEIFVNSEGDYEYNCFDFSEFISGDTLEAMDGGCCTGSARDAVYMAIG